jgi:phytoene synthase
VVADAEWSRGRRAVKVAACGKCGHVGGMTELSAVGRIVQRHDPDRFFTALFAPAAHRETLFVLYATNHELARAREVVSNPMLALIRLQWWREVAEGARRRHEVAGPLGEALDEGRLDAADILAMIDGREAETEPVENVAAFEEYVRATAGGLAVAAGRALGAAAVEIDALREIGSAYGVSGVLRSVPALARQSRTMLPADALAEAGLTDADVFADPADPRLAPVAGRLKHIGQTWLRAGRSRRLPRSVLAAALPGVLARRDFDRPLPLQKRALGDRVLVAAAAAIGRI